MRSAVGGGQHVLRCPSNECTGCPVPAENLWGLTTVRTLGRDMGMQITASRFTPLFDTGTGTSIPSWGSCLTTTGLRRLSINQKPL